MVSVRRCLRRPRRKSCRCAWVAESCPRAAALGWSAGLHSASHDRVRLFGAPLARRSHHAGSALRRRSGRGFFAHGGSRSFYFGYEPGGLAHERACPHWGNLVMFLADSVGQARYRMPRYYGTWLLTHAWADSSGGDHLLHAVRVARAGAPVDDSLLSAYALRRPDGRWSLLLVNRDPRHSRVIEVRVPMADTGTPPSDRWTDPSISGSIPVRNTSFMRMACGDTQSVICRQRIGSVRDSET